MTPREGALLGFGNVAAHGHLPAWKRRHDARIVAVADVDPGRRDLAAELLPGVRLYSEPLSLLDRESVQFVDIATPPTRHGALIIRAADAGSHILSEKPLVTTLDELEQATAAVREAQVALVTVHNWKHSEQFRVATQFLARRALGRVRTIRFDVERSGQSVTVGAPWRTQASLAGGGILVDHGWHAFYLMLALAGERPRRVSATLERRLDVGDVEDTATCLIEFESILGEIRLTWAGSTRRTRWLIEGDRGALELDDNWLELRSSQGVERATFAASLSAGSHHPEWFDAVITDFFAEIDDPSQRGSNLREARLCTTLTALAYASAEAGRPLMLPESRSLDDRGAGVHRDRTT